MCVNKQFHVWVKMFVYIISVLHLIFITISFSYSWKKYDFERYESLVDIIVSKTLYIPFCMR